jgi:hypothetical protein
MKTRQIETLGENELKHKFIEVRTHNAYYARVFVMYHSHDTLNVKYDKNGKSKFDTVKLDDVVTLRTYTN